MSGSRIRPEVPDFDWPDRVQQILIPCAGRLQPEHVLKAFESGTSIVSVIACREDNCCYVEGSTRCSRRLDYLRAILREVGLGEERLLLFHLPGSAAKDLASAANGSVPSNHPDSLNAQIADIRAQVMQASRYYPPSPLLASLSDNRGKTAFRGEENPADDCNDK
jgi:coenzyme F420-reducing hydrogenase delta subunit